MFSKVRGSEKKIKKGGGHIEGLSIGVQTFCTLCIETSPLICFANQSTCFYMIGTSVMKELRLFPTTPIPTLKRVGPKRLSAHYQILHNTFCRI